MRILMIMDGNGIGGAELQFIELAGQLAQRHEVTMLCLRGVAATQEGRLAPGIPVLGFPYASGKKSPPKLLAAIRAGRKVQPEAIVTTAFIGDVVGRAIQLGSKARLLSLQTVSAPKKYPGIDRRVLGGYDTLVAGCRDIRDFLLEQGHDESRIEIVNNWVDFSARVPSEERDETRARFGWQTGDLVIGCIGRMHEQKGQEFLIRGFKAIADQHPQVRLVLVGDGPRMDAMQQEAAGHPRITFTGTITGADYTNLLVAFDIYAQPSRYEGLPRTLLDAMYMGKPIIATAVNGNLDAMRNGENGLTVPAEDAPAISAALTQLITDMPRAGQLAARAAEDARHGFSMVTQTGRIEALLSAE